MQALFLIGLQNSVAVLFLAVIVWVVTRIWRSAPLAHLLWLLLVLKLLTPPFVAVDLVGLTVGRSPPADASVPVQLPLSWSSRSRFYASPTASRSADIELGIAARTAPRIVDTPEAVTAYENSLVLAQVTAISDMLWQMCLPYFVNLWLAGVIVCGLVALRRIVRFQRLVNGMLPAATALQDLTHQLCGRLGITHQPDVRISDRVAAPLFWSLYRQQVIVLPGPLVQQLEPQKLELVLAHELTHLRRRDHWVRWLELIVTVLYWWNPVLWWIRRQLHQAEEQCCDAWVNWLFPDRVKGYAEALLYAAESKSPPPSKIPSLASPFFRCSSGALKGRIRMILRGNGRRTMARPGWTCLIVVAVLILPLVPSWSSGHSNTRLAVGSAVPGGTALPKPAPPPATCQVVGTVKVKGTNEPVANATVNVHISDQGKRYQGQTDATGSYTVAVPPGHARTYGVELPVGYWDDGLTSFEEFATSSAHPVFTKNFFVQREPVWQVRIKPSAPNWKPSNLHVGCHQQLAGRFLYAGCVIDQNSEGLLTIPNTGGTFQFSAGAEDFSLQSIGAVTLRFDKGFRPAAAKAVRQSAPLSFEMTDDQGKRAWLEGAEASVAEHQVVITIPVRIRPPASIGKITGLIVDQDDRPLAGARVSPAFYGQTGSVHRNGDELRGISDSAGRFILPRVPLPFSDDPERSQLGFVVTREGYGGIDTPRFEVRFNSEGIQDVGRIRLRPGYNVRLQVVDRAGKPIADAVVELFGTYAARGAATRTDRDGYCVLKDLDRGYGTQGVSVSYGKHMLNHQVVIENKTYILRMP